MSQDPSINANNDPALANIGAGNINTGPVVSTPPLVGVQETPNKITLKINSSTVLPSIVSTNLAAAGYDGQIQFSLANSLAGSNSLVFTNNGLFVGGVPYDLGNLDATGIVTASREFRIGTWGTEYSPTGDNWSRMFMGNAYHSNTFYGFTSSPEISTGGLNPYSRTLVFVNEEQNMSQAMVLMDAVAYSQYDENTIFGVSGYNFGTQFATTGYEQGWYPLLQLTNQGNLKVGGGITFYPKWNKPNNPVANNTIGITFADGTFQYTAATGQFVTVKDEGNLISTSAAILNFVGDGVTATKDPNSPTGNVVTITVPGLSASKPQIQYFGNTLLTSANTINFTGLGVKVTASVDSVNGNVATVSIPGLNVTQGGILLQGVSTLQFAGTGVTVTGGGNIATVNITGAGKTSPGGAVNQVQINDGAGGFYADSRFYYIPANTGAILPDPHTRVHTPTLDVSGDLRVGQIIDPNPGMPQGNAQYVRLRYNNSANGKYGLTKGVNQSVVLSYETQSNTANVSALVLGVNSDTNGRGVSGAPNDNTIFGISVNDNLGNNFFTDPFGGTGTSGNEAGWSSLLNLTETNLYLPKISATSNTAFVLSYDKTTGRVGYSNSTSGINAITVQSNGVTVLPTNTLNFTGTGVSVSNVGNVGTINIPGYNLAIQTQGSTILSTANTINFTGSGVTTTKLGNVATVTIQGGGSPNGPNYSIQTNNNGSFYGNGLFLYDTANKQVIIGQGPNSSGITDNFAGRVDVVHSGQLFFGSIYNLNDSNSYSEFGRLRYYNDIGSSNIYGFGCAAEDAIIMSAEGYEFNNSTALVLSNPYEQVANRPDGTIFGISINANLGHNGVTTGNETNWTPLLNLTTNNLYLPKLTRTGTANYLLTFDPTTGLVNYTPGSGKGSTYSLAIQNQGNTVVQTANTINFVGSTLTTTGNGNVATVTSNAISGVSVSNQGNIVLASTSAFNFTGSVTVSNVGNVATINVSQTGGGMTVQNQGNTVVQIANTVNFVGTGVVASNVGGVATVAIGDTVYNHPDFNGGTLTIDRNNGSIQRVNLYGSINYISFQNMSVGQSVTIILLNNGQGTGTLFPTGTQAGFLFAGGYKTLTTTPYGIDMMNIFFDGVSYYCTLTTGYA